MENDIQKNIDKVKIYIVDDHQVVRSGLLRFINDYDDFVVCGDTGDPFTAIKEIEQLQPQVVIVDISLKDMNGIELTSEIKSNYDDVLILIHSMHSEPVYAERSIKAGARGYVTKDESLDNIIKAINVILDGNIYLDDSLKNKLLGKLLGPSNETLNNPANCLTNREFEVFKMVGQGLSMRDIADKLELSIKTVQTYRDRIKNKMNLLKSRDLVHYAIQWMLKNKEQ